MTATPLPWRPDGLFDRLRQAAGVDWRRYVDHDFVRALAAGTLPLDCFRHYLTQDYLFLLQWARAKALAIYKSKTFDEIAGGLRALRSVVEETELHVGYCAEWGLDRAAMAAIPEARATVSYTRHVLDMGMSGDLLDLKVAMAPCLIGYAEIGRALLADPATKLDANPYRTWIESYGGDAYQALARDGADELDQLWQSRAGGGRWAPLLANFTLATRLEADFWQMGLEQSL